MFQLQSLQQAGMLPGCRVNRHASRAEQGMTGRQGWQPDHLVGRVVRVAVRGRASWQVGRTDKASREVQAGQDKYYKHQFKQSPTRRG